MLGHGSHEASLDERQGAKVPSRKKNNTLGIVSPVDL